MRRLAQVQARSRKLQLLQYNRFLRTQLPLSRWRRRVSAWTLVVLVVMRVRPRKASAPNLKR